MGLSDNAAAAMGLPELARLYEGLCPEAETPFKAAVRAELERRLAPGDLVEGEQFRFCVSSTDGLVKLRITPRPEPARTERTVTDTEFLTTPTTPTIKLRHKFRFVS